MEDKLPVMFDVPSVFALNTLIRIAEIIKEELEEKNLARKIYFKPDIFMEKEWIVDGQQRIASLYLILSRKPYWMDLDEWNTLLNKYKIRMNVLTLDVALEYPGLKKDSEWIYPQEIFSIESEEELEKIASNLSNKIEKSIYKNLH